MSIPSQKDYKEESGKADSMRWNLNWRERLQSREKASIKIAAEFRMNKDIEVICHGICQKNRDMFFWDLVPKNEAKAIVRWG